MDIVFENAATTWVDLMINFGIIKEGDIINPKKVVLANFMTDDKLISMFEKNKVFINKRA